MRTLRAQKQVKQKRGMEIAADATFSVFEDFEPKVVDMAVYPDVNPWTMFPVYDGSNAQLTEQLGAEGIKAVKDFSEELSNKRYNCMKSGTEFYLTLLVMQKEVDRVGIEKYHALTFRFYRAEVGTGNDRTYEGRAELIVEQNDKKGDKTVLRKIKDMLVDSDTNEALTRFVAAQEWEATTYAILDANVNLGIYKNVHLTLNAPFNCNMKWYVPNRKLVYGYQFTDEYPVYPTQP